MRNGQVFEHPWSSNPGGYTLSGIEHCLSDVHLHLELGSFALYAWDYAVMTTENLSLYLWFSMFIPKECNST
jgi:hypothetical protein